MKLSKIKPNPDNPRILKDDKFGKLVKSIETFPQMMEKRPIVVDENGVVLGGNMRLRALQEIYGKGGEVPDSWITTAEGWSDEQKREFIIKDNASFGEWDWDMLANEWDEADLSDWGVDFPHDEGDGDDSKDKKHSEVKEDDFDPDAKYETKVKAGEIWQLGAHRLMCGDSTKTEDVARLMNGERADLVFTDPPYGMKKESEGVLNDNLNFDDLLEFNKRWIPLTFANLKDNGSWYCWGIDEPLMDIYSNILRPMQKRNEITFRNLITWDKGNGQGQRSEDFRKYAIADEKCLFVMNGVQGFNINQDNYFEGWEPIRIYFEEEIKKIGQSDHTIAHAIGKADGRSVNHWYSKSQFAFITKENYEAVKAYAASIGIDIFKREFEEIKREFEEIKREWYSTRAYFDNTHDNMNNVWHFDRTSAEEREDLDHATPKPIALCARGIKTSSREGEIVLDVFGGSGSTMIACEQLGRKCRMMELDPHYCDVIIARWEKLTGQKAIKLNNEENNSTNSLK